MRINEKKKIDPSVKQKKQKKMCKKDRQKATKHTHTHAATSIGGKEEHECTKVSKVVMKNHNCLYIIARR